MGEVGEVEDEFETGATANTHRDKMVAALVRYLEKRQLVNVTGVTLPGHSPPKKINGTVPDVEGVTSMVGLPVFGAAEECQEYELERSSSRLDALSTVPNSAVFLVVPRVCYAAAKKYVEQAFSDRNITVLPFGKNPNPRG